MKREKDCFVRHYFKIRLLILLALCVNLWGCDSFHPPILNQGYHYTGLPVKNDWLVIGERGSASTLNPILAEDAVSKSVFPFIFESLILYDSETSQPQARLAESWKISNNGKVITFKLRPGVYFHDGRALTTKDVKSTFDLILAPELKRSPLRASLTDLKKIKLEDEFNIRFEFSRAYYRNFISIGLIPILPAHIYQKSDLLNLSANRRPVGSGPYQFKKWDIKEGISLNRFKEYWGNKNYFWSQKNNFQMIQVKFFQEPEALYAAAEAQEVDLFELKAGEFTQRINPTVRDQFYYQLQYYTENGSGFNFIALNFNRPLFQQKEVRIALNKTVPRKKLNQTIYQSLRKSSVGHFSQGTDRVPRSLEPIKFDPKGARELLENNGWKNPRDSFVLSKKDLDLRFELLVPLESLDGQKLAQLLQKEFREIGIFMGIKVRPWPVLVRHIRNGIFDAALLGWNLSVDADPYALWHSSGANGKGSNYMNYKNKELDHLLEKARGELDREQRNEIFKQFSVLLQEESPIVFLFEKPSLYYVARRFEKVLPVGQYGLDVSRWFTPPGLERYATPIEKYRVSSSQSTADRANSLQGGDSSQVERLNFQLGPRRLQDAVSKSLEEFKRQKQK